ncbi:hypothetical protein ADK70_20720 [Streptomyces rimosus subsp. pseudoverticillatus]|nr:hypothetical protein ADK70_20720 [Streptomyces rimosus subsp. pseudoverticillatus]
MTDLRFAEHPECVANEGCLVAYVPEARADDVLHTMRRVPEGASAVRIGRTTAAHPGRVELRTRVGSHRVIDMPLGEQLPRIC